MVRQAHHVRFDKLTMITLSLPKGDKLIMITLSLPKGDKLIMIIKSRITLSLSKGGHAVYKVHLVSVGLRRPFLRINAIPQPR